MSKQIEAFAAGVLNGVAGAIRKKRANAPLAPAFKPVTPLDASKSKTEMSEYENAWENDLTNVDDEPASNLTPMADELKGDRD